MPSDKIDASPADLRKLASSLAVYKQEVSAAAKKVQIALASANWHDARKQEFEARYRDLQRRIDGFMSTEVDQMAKVLKELARRLDDARNIRM